MNTALWILQIALAVIFFLAGLMKLTQPREKLLARMGWVQDFSQPQIRMIGTVELLAALGLVLPPLTNILPVLAPLAAAGLVLTMLGAAWVHIRRSEYSQIVMNAIFGVMAVLVIYGRFVVIPVQ